MKIYVFWGLLALLLLFINHASAQPYVPRVSQSTMCPDGQAIASFGNNDISQLSSQTSTTPPGTIVARQFNITSAGVTINQLSLGLSDNLNIVSVTRLRLGLFQLVGARMVLLAESEEVLLFATPRLVVYVNLLKNVTLNIDTYYIGVWSSASIFTGVDDTIQGQHNRATASYSNNGLPNSVALVRTTGTIALQAHGCASDNLFTAPNTQIIKFCAYMQSVTAAPFATSTATAQAQTHTFTGTLAVSTTDIGSDSHGEWRQITAGFAELVIQTSSAEATSVAQTQFERSLVLGGALTSSYNQRLYQSVSINTMLPGNPGISFVSSIPGNGEQYVLAYHDDVYHLDNLSPGTVTHLHGVVADFVAIVVGSVDAAGPQCQPPSQTPAPDAFSCPADSAIMKFGDDTPSNAASVDSSLVAYLTANVMFFKTFTATSPRVQLKQLSMVLDANPSNIIKLRLGLFTNVRSVYQLVEQTRELTLVNSDSVVIQLNLLNPVSLQYGQNYSIGVISDKAILAPGASFMASPSHTSVVYADLMNGPGFPSSVTTSTTSMTPFVGALGCAAGQSTTTYDFCSSFVYATYTTMYTGTLTALTVPMDDGEGQYRLIISGTGVASQIFANNDTSRSFPFTLHSLNMQSNNKLYVSGTPIDQFGLQFVVRGTPGYGVQLFSFYDPLSGTREFRENSQASTSTTVTFLRNIVSSFTVRAHSADASLPQCQPLSRPVNSVIPASVPRVICSNLDNSIIDTFGDSAVSSFSQKADGTTIAANKIYTFPFTPVNSAAIRQLAVGLLNNMDRTGDIRVRLGLYAEGNSSLIVQTEELRLNEAVDQVVIMNLPYAVSVMQNQSYFIAIFASSALEVATTSSESSPSMLTTFGAGGLPAMFISSGLDVIPSIAAIACVSSTHSFCSYYQYHVAEAGTSTTLMYQGLLQASSLTTDNSYGTGYDVMAIGGRLITYSRANFATQTVNVYPFWQRPDLLGRIYTDSANNQALDTTGLQLELEGGLESTLLFNQSIGKLDDSFSGMTNQERSLIYSGFSVTPLSSGDDIPACGLSMVPYSVPDVTNELSCPSGESLIGYGDADTDDLLNSSEGFQIAVSNLLYLRSFVSHSRRATLLSHLKFGININYNTVNRIRLGIYSQNFSLMGVTDDILMINPHDQVFTGVVKVPVYLKPATRYFLAVHTEKTIYTGFSPNVNVPTASVEFVDGLPQTFVQTQTNSQRAIAGWACTTAIQPEVDPVESTSHSNSGMSDGAIAGLVVGLVIGTNLLLLLAIYLCCMSNATKKGRNYQTELPSRVETSQVELNNI